MKDNTLITITRQYGSGGLAVAKAVAKIMGVKCYNRDIVVQAAANIKNFEDIKDVIAESAARAKLLFVFHLRGR